MYACMYACIDPYVVCLYELLALGLYYAADSWCRPAHSGSDSTAGSAGYWQRPAVGSLVEHLAVERTTYMLGIVQLSPPEPY